MNTKIAFPTVCGIFTALAFSMFIMSLKWELNIASAAVGIFLTAVAFVYGKVVAHLLVESYWFTKGESQLSIAMLFWGWLGVGIGIFMYFPYRFDFPSYLRILSILLWTGIAWGGPLFPIKVFSLKSE